MSAENVFWGAPRLNGELLKLRFAGRDFSFGPAQLVRAMLDLK
jgi:hypothetical protein